MNKWLALVSGVTIALLIGALILKAGAEPKLIGLTAQCESGYYTTAKRGKGVCSGHGGVKRWIE